MKLITHPIGDSLCVCRVLPSGALEQITTPLDPPLARLLAAAPAMERFMRSLTLAGPLASPAFNDVDKLFKVYGLDPV